MTIRNLDKLFRPASVALIGASDKPQSIGQVIAHNLWAAGFHGPIMPVSPSHPSICGVLTYRDVASLPVTPDLAIVCTPPDTVPGLVGELGARGTKGVVVITAGFGEGNDAHGKALLDEMLKASKPHLLRIIGPNCLGVVVPPTALNGSFAHLMPAKGDLAFVSQSGAILVSVIDWAVPRRIGFSHLISLGAMADVDFGDVLDYLAGDPGTRAILLYVEAVTNARKFMSAARAASRLKPVIVIKAGRHAEGAKAALSHTGALAGADEVYDAAFRRAGMLRVYELDELFAAVEVLASLPPMAGNRLAILSNGGGMGVLATDSLIEQGGHLAELAPETIAALDGVLPRTWSHGNPVDIIGDAPGKRYADALTKLLQDPGSDAVVVLNCPTAVASSFEAAQAVAEVVRGTKRPVITAWIGGDQAEKGRELFSARRVPTFDTPEQAIRGFMHLVRYRRNQEMLMQTPPSVPGEFAADSAAAHEIIAKAIAEGRSVLTEFEAKAVLGHYGIPVARTVIAANPDEAAMRAAEIGGLTAVKILSPDISHKSDVGGVALNLETPEAVRIAAEAMLGRVHRTRPEARITGFTVQEMVRRSAAHELIVGVSFDRQFGPVILFGQGGVAVEVVGDKALSLAPLNMVLAHELIRRTRIFKLLQGYRDRPPADLEAIALTLVQVSTMVCDLAELVELDINPLLADSRGVIALDARIVVASAEGRSAASRLAIRPYPKELEQSVHLADDTLAQLRPVRPEDEPALQETFSKLSAEDIRLRFFAPIKRLPHEMAARLTQIDYDREMAFVLERMEKDDHEIIGVVRLMCDPDNTKGEFAIVVRSDLKGQGLGYMLMNRILEYGRARGLQEVYGQILSENKGMLQMCQELGFHLSRLPDEPTVTLATLTL